MLDVIAIALSIGSLVITLLTWTRIAAWMSKHDKAALLATPPPPALESFSFNAPLEGIRIGIDIQQDHERPTFAEILCQRLEAEDAHATIGTTGDILIRGTLTCNGYSDVYYAAHLECFVGEQRIAAVVEKPAEGGRQTSLAIELVSRLKAAVEAAASRAERQQALREIRE